MNNINEPNHKKHSNIILKYDKYTIFGKYIKFANMHIDIVNFNINIKPFLIIVTIIFYISTIKLGLKLTFKSVSTYPLGLHIILVLFNLYSQLSWV